MSVYHSIQFRCDNEACQRKKVYHGMTAQECFDQAHKERWMVNRFKRNVYCPECANARVERQVATASQRWQRKIIRDAKKAARMRGSVDHG